MLETMGRNTAPAVAMAAFHALDTDPNLLALPSDQLPKDTTAFEAAITKAALPAFQGHLVTFGIKPVTPHTGYGHVKGGEAIDDQCRRSDESTARLQTLPPQDVSA